MTEPIYPKDPTEVVDLLQKFRSGKFTRADLSKAIKILADAQVVCTKAERKALEAEATR